jgi:hypothetical protein
MIHAVIEFTKSAFKHDITEENIRHAMLNPVYDNIQDSGDSHLLIGFDNNMNLLEVAYNIVDEQTYKVFHAMKCRNSYLSKIER